MSGIKVCSHCTRSLSDGAHFCPTCGYLASPESANWFDRLCAAIVDLCVLVAISGLLMRLGLGWWVIPLIWLVFIEIGYRLKGSVGKSFVGICVPVKTRLQHYVREIIGKLASSAIFGIGFLMILSRERLALHDYMAKTKVVRIVSAATLRQAIVSLSLLFALLAGAYLFLRTEYPNSLPKAVRSSEPSPLGLIVKKIPSVATIYVYSNRGKLVGQGSGFLITSDGVGVTNFHVIKDAYSAEVKLGDGRLYQVLAVHAYNKDRDIAVIQLGRKMSLGVEPAIDLPHLEISTEEVRIGDHIATVGSPEGLSNSVSDGLVSAIRNVGEEQLLQITAPISPGSSGGPVLNLKGEVVAITSFQFSEGQNLNFAIPINEVSKICTQRAYLPLEHLYEQTHVSNAQPAVAEGKPSDNEKSSTSSTPPVTMTGFFLGTVHNVNVNLAAQFVLFIEDHHGTIQGCFGVKSPLYGSGPLQGSVHGDDVQFRVTSPLFYLRFEGKRNTDKEWSGTYTAVPQGGKEQSGYFDLEKKDSKKYFESFNPETNCPTDDDMNR